VRAPVVSRVDLFSDGLLASAVPVGAPSLGTMTDAQIDAAVARERKRVL
jgi:hypothetical protein